MRPLRPALLALALLAPGPAAAQLALCNRTSFALDAALAVEAGGASATRGWFRLDPGQCRPVLAGEMSVDRLFLHARALPIYGRDPFAQGGHRDLCVADGDFLIAGGERCEGPGRRLVAFTEVRPKPSETGGGIATLAEDADYGVEAARLAGLQRLLALAGFEAGAVDGVSGPRTEAALADFLRDRGLPADTAGPALFAALVEAAGGEEGRGITWCNDTRHTVMAALGHEERGTIVTRGWWRIEPGRCLKPELDRRGSKRFYSYAEAVDGDGRVIERTGRPLAWGGASRLCTRNTRFEVREQRDCAVRGLDTHAFIEIDLSGMRGATVRFDDRAAGR